MKVTARSPTVDELMQPARMPDVRPNAEQSLTQLKPLSPPTARGPERVPCVAEPVPQILVSQPSLGRLLRGISIRYCMHASE